MITWEHDSIEKYVVLVGTLINNISVNVYNKEADAHETSKVPVTYGPREKVLAAANRPSIDEDENVANIAITLPRIAFECTGMMYDPSRATPATKKVVLNDETYIRNPAPWNFPFTISIVAKSARTANRILEQVVGKFAGPAISITLKPLKAFPTYTKDITIELQGVQINNTYQGDFADRQYVGWDVEVLLKGWMFGPLIEGGLITKVDVDFTDQTTVDEFLEGIDIKPGLTSEGGPTSIENDSIPRNEIKKTDNYGYITDYNSEGEDE